MLEFRQMFVNYNWNFARKPDRRSCPERMPSNFFQMLLMQKFKLACAGDLLYQAGFYFSVSWHACDNMIFSVSKHKAFHNLRERDFHLLRNILGSPDIFFVRLDFKWDFMLLQKFCHRRFVF